VGLNFKNFLEILSEDLDCSGSVWVSNTCNQEFTLETSNNLTVTSSFFISTSLLSLQRTNFALFVSFSFNFPDWFVWTSCIHYWLGKINVSWIGNIWLWSVNCNTVESIVFNFVLPDRLSNLSFNTCISSIVKLLFLIEFPKVNTRVPTTSYKACVIFEPADWFDKVLMSLEKEVIWCFTSIEFINANILCILACKVLSSVRELNFTTVLNWDWLESNQTGAKYIHHLDTLSKADNNMETTWMQS